MGVSSAGLTYQSFRGEEIEAVIEGLAKLRIAVFKDFPYLYDGDLEYEKSYLKTYINSKNSFLFSVFDNGVMVGATTCIPLMDETEEVQKPFLDNKIDLDSVFYFGESILLSNYRGLGIGNKFFDEREAHASQFQNIDKVCFCAVKRPFDHKLKPADYVPLDGFWTKRGYKKSEGIISIFDWKDVDEEESSEKSMEYWFKAIS